MDLDEALAFVAGRRLSVLATIRGNGHPQLSTVVHAVGADGLVRVSVTAHRAKYANLLHRPWAVLHVGSEDGWSYAVLEGDVTMSPVAADPHDATVAELVTYYRTVSGEHPDWDGYRRSMVAEERVVVRLHPVHAYGQLPSPG